MAIYPRWCACFGSCVSFLFPPATIGACYLLLLAVAPTTGWAQSMANQHVSSAAIQANQGVAGDDPSVSDDGRYVAFASPATNLVAGDTNGQEDIFVHDNLTSVTVLISEAFGGGGANGSSRRPWLSSTGRYVAFQSLASNLVAGDANGTVDVFRVDRDTRPGQRFNRRAGRIG